MTTFAAFQSRILAFLGDPSALRFSPALLEEALSQALQEYSVAIPCLKSLEFTVTAPSREQTIGAVPSFFNVLRVIFPCSPPTPLQSFHAYHTAGSLTLYIGGPLIPAVADHIQIDYTLPHTIHNLAGATSTTTNPAHTGLIVQGAAGLAALLRSASIAENYGKRPDDLLNLFQWGKEQHTQYLAVLQMLAAGHTHAPSLPSAGWSLDTWD